MPFTPPLGVHVLYVLGGHGSPLETAIAGCIIVFLLMMLLGEAAVGALRQNISELFNVIIVLIGLIDIWAIGLLAEQPYWIVGAGTLCGFWCSLILQLTRWNRRTQPKEQKEK